MARRLKSCPITAIGRALPGTCEAGRAVITDSNNKIDTLDITTPKVNGTALAATAAEIHMVADVSSFIGSYTATSPAAIPATVRVIELNHASVVIAKTIASLVPYAGQFVVIKDTSATGTAAHTVTVTTGTWNGTNKVITVDALNECIVVFIDSAGNGTIVENVGTVGVSG